MKRRKRRKEAEKKKVNRRRMKKKDKEEKNVRGKGVKSERGETLMKYRGGIIFSVRD